MYLVVPVVHTVVYYRDVLSILSTSSTYMYLVVPVVHIIGMTLVVLHYAHTFEICTFHFYNYYQSTNTYILIPLRFQTALKLIVQT